MGHPAKFPFHEEVIGHDQLTFNASMMSVDLDREIQQYKSTEFKMLCWFIASNIGLFVSLYAYYIILTRIVTSGALTQKLDAQIQQEGAISDDKQTGNTNLKKDV
jgi:heme/copper-type cytochrome/quinol oxidase subunit 3